MSEYDPNYIPNPSYFLLGVKIVLLNPKGEILLLRRSDKVSRAHGWDLPGGGVDKGENPYDSAIRELFEETGITINNLSLVDTSFQLEGDDEVVIIGYAGRADHKDPSLSWEHDAFEWVSQTKINEYNLPKLHFDIIKNSLKYFYLKDLE